MNPTRLYAQTVIETKLMLRQGENFLLSFGIPIAILVLAKTLPTFPHPKGISAITWTTPGVIAISIMSAGMVTLGITTGFERYYSVIKRFGVTPLTRLEFFWSKAAAICIILTLQIVSTLGIACLLGFSLTITQALTIIPIILFGLTAFAGVGLFIAGRLPAMATLAIVNALFFLAIGTSGIAFDIANFPTWVGNLFRLFPALPLVELLRYTMIDPTTITATAVETAAATKTATATASTAGLSLSVPWLSIASLFFWASISPFVAMRSFKFT